MLPSSTKNKPTELPGRSHKNYQRSVADLNRCLLDQHLITPEWVVLDLPELLFGQSPRFIPNFRRYPGLSQIMQNASNPQYKQEVFFISVMDADNKIIAWGKSIFR
jgi:hypothetical protein